MEKESKELRHSHKNLLEENASLKDEVQKGVKGMAKALGDRYGHCLSQVSSAGFNVVDHSFDDYIRDYASSSVVRKDDHDGQVEI